MKRVVITGIGALTPLSRDVNTSWEKLINSESGIEKITRFDVDKFPSQIGGCVPGFIPQEYSIKTSEISRMDLFIQYAIAAAKGAIIDSGLETEKEDLTRIGVLTGSGIGGLKNIENTSAAFYNEGKRVSPYFIPSTLINLISGHISMKYGFMGPNHSVVTACSSSTHAIGDAMRLIRHGYADVMITGGAESGLTPIGVAGFCACRALSTNYNDSPKEASRPWDRDRDGFVISEGAGILVVEEYERAKKRGAKIYAEVLGYGMSGDAYHITAPHPEGKGAKLAVNAALLDAKVSSSKIDYINAHGTSTPIGDKAELMAMQDLFENITMSSTKSSIGHMLGGAGAVEAIFTALAMKNSIAPPTLNLHNPIDVVKLDLVPLFAKDINIEYAISNSFGFGGTNASLVFKKV